MAEVEAASSKEDSAADRFPRDGTPELSRVVTSCPMAEGGAAFSKEDSSADRFPRDGRPELSRVLTSCPMAEGRAASSKEDSADNLFPRDGCPELSRLISCEQLGMSEVSRASSNPRAGYPVLARLKSWLPLGGRRTPALVKPVLLLAGPGIIVLIMRLLNQLIFS